MTPASAPDRDALAPFARSARAQPYEVAIWILAALAIVLFPGHAALWNEIAILTLFAVSLDLILGYGGIVSLGQAAFFGTGSYGAEKSSPDCSSFT